MKKSFPFYRQLDHMDCGPTCLRMISKFYGKSYDTSYLREISSLTGGGSTIGGLAEAAEKIGFSSLVISSAFQDLSESVPVPCIAHWRQRHFVVVVDVSPQKVKVADPGFGIIDYKPEDFCKGWIPEKNPMATSEGILLLLECTPEFYESGERASPRKTTTEFLGRYYKPFKKFTLQLIVGLIVGSFIQLSLPFLTQQIVDVGINARNINFVYLILAAQLMLFISQTALSIIRSWILLHVTSRINLRMLSDFLIKLMNLPISFFDAKTHGDLLQRIQDHNRIQAFLTATSLDVLFSLIPFLAFSAILLYFNVTIFSVFVIGSALYIIWIFMFLKKRAEIDFKYFDQASGNQSSTIQLISGIQEIKLNGSQRRRRWEWEAIQARLFKLNIRSLALSQSQTEGGRFINELKNIFTSFFAARSVIDGNMTFGEMLAVQYIIGQLNVPLSNFVQFIRGYQDARLSIERLQEIHGKSNEEATGEIQELPEGSKDITLEDVSFRYGSNASPLVLKNINITIPEGKVTAIVGASGSGKTTLLKLLLKYFEPSNGNVFLGGTSLKNYGSNFWRSQCGVVMQDGYIFADSVARNISESDPDGGINRSRLAEAIEISNIGRFIDELPNGRNTRIGSSGMGISGGQRQRVLIARAVYKQPRFLFFDEATSALDATNEAIIIGNLQRFFKGRSVVVVAHRLSTVVNADQIIVLDKGEAVEIGTHAELTARKGHYFQLIKNQLELGN